MYMPVADGRGSREIDDTRVDRSTGPARLTRVRNWRHACWPHRPSSASGHSKGVVALVKARRLSCLEF